MLPGLYFFDEKVHEQDPEFLTVVLPAAQPFFPAGSPNLSRVEPFDPGCGW